MSMLGKMSTTMRWADRTPIIKISSPAMAMVYGRRNARRTSPIIEAHPHSEPRDFFALSRRPLALLQEGANPRQPESFLLGEMIHRTAPLVQAGFRAKPGIPRMAKPPVPGSWVFVPG